MHNYYFIYYPIFCHPYCSSVISQFFSLTIIHFILGVISGSLTFLVPMSANCRPLSHQSILCIFYFLNSLQNSFSSQCVWCVWYTYHSYPCTWHIYYSRQSKELPLELWLYPSSSIHESTFWNVLKPFLHCMLNCTQFLYLIEKLVLEHVCHGQLAHLDERSYILL